MGNSRRRDTVVDVDEETFQAREPLPRCPRCDALARPNVLMFGDWSWIGARSEVQGSRLNHWFHEIAGQGMRLGIVEMGAGETIPTVRYLSENVARAHHATLIRINPRDHEVPDPRHISLPVGSKEGIGAIFSLYGKS
jgi:NAD-dependent SIR2 family protein deacetylase